MLSAAVIANITVQRGPGADSTRADTGCPNERPARPRLLHYFDATAGWSRMRPASSNSEADGVFQHGPSTRFPPAKRQTCRLGKRREYHFDSGFRLAAYYLHHWPLSSRSL